MMSVAIDRTGKRYGTMVVLYRVGSDKHGKALWCVKCDCGRECKKTATLLMDKRVNVCSSKCPLSNRRKPKKSGKPSKRELLKAYRDSR